MTGKVTSIISAYFCEEYLDGRIENLQQQTEKPDIIAVAQRGQGEAKILEKHPTVKVILTDDIPTIYQAWNMGIKAAKTLYITNANADDRLDPNALKIFADILDKYTDFGLVYADVDIVTEIGGNPISRYEWASGGFKELMKGCFIGPMPVWRKVLHDRIGYFDESFQVAGDYEMWLRFASRGVKFFHYKDRPLGCYLKRENSAEHREPLRSLWEANRARMMYREVVC